MIRLLLNFDGQLLRARVAQPVEEFTHFVNWKHRIEFSISDSTVLMMSWTSLLPDLRATDAEALTDLVSARYPLSVDYKELGRLCPELTVGHTENEWTFYGGSFNPWHEGHQACLDLLPKDKLCFVIPDHSPHKDLREVEGVSNLIDLSHKMKFGKKQFLVPTFLLEKKKNPTVDWVERLARTFPEKKLSLLLGFDSLRSIRTWTRSDDLLKNLHKIYVASRLEDELEQKSIKEELKLINGALEIVFLGRHPHENASSTVLRQK